MLLLGDPNGAETSPVSGLCSITGYHEENTGTHMPGLCWFLTSILLPQELHAEALAALFLSPFNLYTSRP